MILIIIGQRLGVSEHDGFGGFERRRNSLLIVLSRPSSKEVCFVKVTHLLLKLDGISGRMIIYAVIASMFC